MQSVTITITFKPTQALYYKSFAYCNISCADERLKLTIDGEGRGPMAQLTPVNEKDIGDIFIGQEYEEWINIENGGQIDCHFKLLENDTPFSKMFDFKVQDRILKVDEKLAFKILFKSTILGEFSETFRW